MIPPPPFRELGFRLSYEDLGDIMDMLFSKFVTGTTGEHPQVSEMRRRCYTAAWNNVLSLAGWMQNEFDDEVNSRYEALLKKEEKERQLLNADNS